jgi:hypothetical protein
VIPPEHLLKPSTSIVEADNILPLSGGRDDIWQKLTFQASVAIAHLPPQMLSDDLTS